MKELAIDGNRIAEELPCALVALDAAGTVIHRNALAVALLGECKESCIFAARFLELDQPLITQALAEPAASAIEDAHLVCDDGALVTISLNIGPRSADPEAPRFVFMFNASERVAREREYEQRATMFAFAAELSETLSHEIDSEQGFDRIAALLREYLSLTGFALARSSSDGSPRALVGAWGLTTSTLTRWLAQQLNNDFEATTRELSALAEQTHPQSTVRLFALSVSHEPVGQALFVADKNTDAHSLALMELAVRALSMALKSSSALSAQRTADAERTLLLDAIPTWVFRVDAETTQTLYVNGAVLRGLQLHEGRMTPSLLDHFASDDDREDFRNACKIALEMGSSPWSDRRFITGDRRILTLRTRLYRLVGARGEGPVIEGIADDVTEELETRKQLVHTDRLASLGTLAAGVAHEINNPSTFILLGTQQLSRLLAQTQAQSRESTPALDTLNARMTEIVADLSEGVQRITQIVGELRLFARIPEDAVSTPVDLNRLIRSALTLTQAELRQHANVQIELGSLPPLPGSYTRLGQVFVNLLINAAQAFPHGRNENNSVTVKTWATDDSVFVSVADTGEGIAPENLSRIYDPFFTTKAPGEGTGLGLSISVDLIKRVGGTLHAESTVGVGTTFTMQLPIRTPTPTSAPPPRSSSVVPRGTRVLVVEDEQPLAVALSRALSSRFVVEHAADGVLALEKLVAAQSVFYDVVLCDLRIPGIDGLALYESVLASHPQQAHRFVFLSGASSVERPTNLEATGRPILEKPFHNEDLDEVLTLVLQRAKSA
ncbi:MAG: ATP-binding protein [Deltaproteobacteria bacterium]|nr:ATP-binding protein [Deltaproteobacteria bacterium]